MTDATRFPLSWPFGWKRAEAQQAAAGEVQPEGNGLQRPARRPFVDALGVLVYLRDFGREPMGAVSIEPTLTSAMAALLATLPNQQGALL